MRREKSNELVARIEEGSEDGEIKIISTVSST